MYELQTDFREEHIELEVTANKECNRISVLWRAPRTLENHYSHSFHLLKVFTSENREEKTEESSFIFPYHYLPTATNYMDTWDTNRACQSAAPEITVIHHSPEHDGIPEESLAVAVDLFSAVMVTWVWALCWRSCWMSFRDSDRPVPSYLKSRRQKSEANNQTAILSHGEAPAQNQAAIQNYVPFWGLWGPQPPMRITAFWCSCTCRTGKPTLSLS